jgi:triosephosphate isomerase
MNGTVAGIKHLLQDLLQNREIFASMEMAVFPPYIYLELVSQYLKGSPITWGAQNVFNEASGAYTGEISIDMLKEFNCRYVIVGHSERRTLFGETDNIVAAKFAAVLKAGLHPILCVGETAQERQAGDTLNVIERQLAAALKLADNLPNLSQAVIAYEPVWAIGTGQNATPAQAQEVHHAIRQKIEAHQSELGEKMRIIYGGSVKAENAAALLSEADIDGALVGGASLKAEQFIEIAKQCKH